MVEGSKSFAVEGRGVCLFELAKFLPRSFNYVLLHKNLVGAELSFLHTNENWLSLSSTFFEAAAIFRTLDSVIRIDTSMAHLSSTLVIPTTILLSFRFNWRWGENRKRTNWYPDCVLMRQSQSDGWEPVFVALHQNLT
jgi:hypothetical protein